MLLENIENYKKKLLSSYWTEINLIGYKIELLEKQKVEYLKEKSRILYIGNKISEIIEENKRSCFNCGATQPFQWYKYLKEHYLCNVCGTYNRNNGKFRTEQMLFRASDIRNRTEKLKRNVGYKFS
uniref:GATA-type domain-containing protein n=1 Tax=Meloidogyne enterolobii TaxID=390850 RepID=A0A6V7W2D5_MELEN|nr:unnamed protein product [Meloidogyne enterolobii]